ncbi:hypothetical protein MNEG_11174 [Monoraphidium neglectum]|uniref:Uncharacterized protein n=1 Tax=Monoraphidium neglectum TaxID=145388 RepID=A0A0D2LZH3_9CHLO|nr:hypothetical protein MNEG_11174 [Monoraphidium neglectum]KIY96789.1 hypothetical protein MNEG_11174 [Monoraphidium neglectum]|eukprot:XP_013895809.1 hypothetical protein MNEG_11174 [Monoraphidium neglectum]
MQFDNRGVKVQGERVAANIARAVADCICNIPLAHVKYLGTMGQSGLLNHQAVSTYTCTGPTNTGQPLLKACQTNTRGGLLTSSIAAKCIKKYTDTWVPLDSVELQKATCTPSKGPPSGK